MWPSTNLWKSSEFFVKWLEIFGISSKTSLSVRLYNKQNNIWLLVDIECLFLCSTLYLTHSQHPLVWHQVENSKRHSISTRDHELSSICNGNRTEWSPIRSAIIQVITDLFIKSMITDGIGWHEVSLSISHKNYNFRKKNSQIMKKKGKICT